MEEYQNLKKRLLYFDCCVNLLDPYLFLFCQSIVNLLYIVILTIDYWQSCFFIIIVVVLVKIIQFFAFLSFPAR